MKKYLSTNCRGRRGLSVLMLCVLVLNIVLGAMPAAAADGVGELTCVKAEHTHTDACYEQVLNCVEEHEHTEACYIPACTQEEHTHSDDCYAQEEPTEEPEDPTEETEAPTEETTASTEETAAPTEEPDETVPSTTPEYEQPTLPIPEEPEDDKNVDAVPMAAAPVGVVDNALHARLYDGTWLNLAYVGNNIIVNEGDMVELCIVLTDVKAADGKATPNPEESGFWWASDAGWPASNWARVDGREDTWLLTTSIKIDANTPGGVWVGKNGTAQFTGVGFTVKELPNLDMNRVYVQLGENADWTKNSGKTYMVEEGTKVTVTALMDNLLIAGNQPDMSNWGGSGFWNSGTIQQSWEQFNTLKSIWQTTTPVYTMGTGGYPNTSSLSLNLGRNGYGYLESISVSLKDATPNIGKFYINTPDEGLVPVDNYTVENDKTFDVIIYLSEYVYDGTSPGKDNLELAAIISYNNFDSSSVVTIDNVNWDDNARTVSATISAKEIGNCVLVLKHKTSSYNSTYSNYLYITVVENVDVSNYDLNTIYVKNASGEYVDVDAVTVQPGETVEMLAVLEGPLSMSGSVPDMAYGFNGFSLYSPYIPMVDQSQPAPDAATLPSIDPLPPVHNDYIPGWVNAHEWTQLPNGNWLVTFKVTPKDGGKFVFGLSRNSIMNIDTLTVTAIPAAGKILVNNMQLGNMYYTGVEMHTATRMLSGDFTGNSQTNPYIAYVGESLSVSTKAGTLKLYSIDTSWQENLEKEGASITYTPNQVGYYRVDLEENGKVTEVFYINVLNTIYVETALGNYNKNYVREYVETSMYWLKDSRPELLITAPNGTPLYVKNTYEYPYIVSVGDTVVLNAYGDYKIYSLENPAAPAETEGLTAENKTRALGTVELTANAEGIYVVDFGGEGFFVRVEPNTNINHFDIEIADGGTYTIHEISHFTDGRRLEVVTYYHATINDIYGCQVYAADGSPIIAIEQNEYWKHDDDQDTQYEFTSAYQIGADGKLVTDDEGRPALATREAPRSEVAEVVFSLDLHLKPYKRTVTMYESKEDLVGHPYDDGKKLDTLERNVDAAIALDKHHIIDAINKCPDNSGADFVVQDIRIDENAAGDLIVTKTVTGKNGDTERDFDFTVTFTDVEGVAIEGTFEYYDITDVAKDNVIVAGTEGKLLGELTLVNGVASFSLKHGQLIKINGLPAGTHYEVTEETPIGYVLSVNGVIGETAASGVIENERIDQADFTNEYKAGDLTVTKTVTGTDGDKEKAFTFTVTLSEKSINGTYGQMTFKDGVATFKLKHGESLSATGLPAGITYTVVESDNAGYAVTSTGNTGTIKADEVAVAAFTNHKDEVPKTGDSAMPSAWFAAMVVSMFGMVAVLTTWQRKKQ